MSETIFIAKSHHGKCFICGQGKKLSRVKSQSIVSAMINYRIQIKDGTRCFRSHIDKQTRCIKESEFSIIRENSQQSTETVILAKHINNIQPFSNIGIFDRFNDLETLDDE